MSQQFGKSSRAHSPTTSSTLATQPFTSSNGEPPSCSRTRRPTTTRTEATGRGEKWQGWMKAITSIIPSMPPLRSQSSLPQSLLSQLLLPLADSPRRWGAWVLLRVHRRDLPSRTQSTMMPAPPTPPGIRLQPLPPVLAEKLHSRRLWSLYTRRQGPPTRTKPDSTSQATTTARTNTTLLLLLLRLHLHTLAVSLRNRDPCPRLYPSIREFPPTPPPSPVPSNRASRLAAHPGTPGSCHVRSLDVLLLRRVAVT